MAGNTFSMLKIGLAVKDREDLFRTMVSELENLGLVPEVEAPVHALLEREEDQSTALGAGIALPHARSRALSSLTVTAARLETPIEFDAPDGEPVDLVFMILGPKDQPEEHVRMLGRLAKMISRPGVVDNLRSAQDENAFLSHLAL